MATIEDFVNLDSRINLQITKRKERDHEEKKERTL